MYEKLIKHDDIGKYYLVDSDKFIFKLNGVNRLQAYQFLIDIGVVNELQAWRCGIENYVQTIDKILDGTIRLGRFKFYRVSQHTEKLDEQLEIERRRSWEVRAK